jgi:hypothetical protein
LSCCCGKISQASGYFTSKFRPAQSRVTEKQRHFSFGTLPAMLIASPIGGSKKGVSKMTFSFLDSRQLAVSLAGAFITSLLFVSAATSLPIA